MTFPLMPADVVVTERVHAMTTIALRTEDLIFFGLYKRSFAIITERFSQQMSHFWHIEEKTENC